MAYTSLLGVAVAGGVGAAFAAGQMTAAAAHAPAPQPVKIAAPRPQGDAASQHAAAAPAATPAKPAAPAIDPALLHAASYLAAHPVHTVAAAPIRDLDCMTAAVYYEARGESAAGQAAVAQVVLNRVRHPAFPKSVCGVVYQGAAGPGCQFSFACNGAMHARHEPAAWARARAVAGRALAGYVMPDVGRATHFHVATLGAVWGGEMTRIATVGDHIFYAFSGRHAGAGHVAREPSEAAPEALPPGPPADGGAVAAVSTQISDKTAAAPAPATSAAAS